MATYAFVQNYRKRIIFRQNRVRMAGLNARLQDSLGGISVHVVGDAVKARRAIDALREAYELAVLL